MCAALEHRGPDSRGLHIDDGVGLGIQRLRVIDLSIHLSGPFCAMQLADMGAAVI